MTITAILIGLILVVAAIRGNQDELFDLVKDDFTGSNNFIVWIVAIGFLFALTKVEQVKPIANAFIGLLLLVVIIGNRNFPQEFMRQVKAGTN